MGSKDTIQIRRRVSPEALDRSGGVVGRLEKSGTSLVQDTKSTEDY